MSKKIFSLDLGNGTELKVETGRLAQMANGSALVSIGDTVVLATACMSPKPTNLDFLPLLVSYQEKTYAAGMMKHSRINKREARPSDDNILSARVIDRTLRPMFPKGFNHNLQTLLTIMSYDKTNAHDIVAGLGASIAFSLSDAPFEGPTAMVRVGRIDGEFLLNPSEQDRKKSDLDLIVSCTEKAIVMIEAAADQVTEDVLLKALEFGFGHGQKICRFIEGIANEVGLKNIEYTPRVLDARIEGMVKEKYDADIEEAMFDENSAKKARFAKFGALKEDAVATLGPVLNEGVESGDDSYVEDKDITATFEKVMKNHVRFAILQQERRIKGRKLDEVRPISCELDILPRVHGSGLFNRGETQGLSIVTLAGPEHKLTKTGVEGESLHRYFHHYNFPPYSVGEVSNRLFTGNREIGHGSLGEKALLPVLPDEKDFPYTIRVVTEILSSNGSSSMASACGSTLALMAAGVPLKAPVAGIAMGLMTDPDTGVFKVLTDLQDEEDFGGDMDFKVAGTKDGITVIQMDIKLKGIKMEVFHEAFESARVGRLKILADMLAVISEPRKELSEYAPRMQSIQIEKDMIRNVIGKGGETINKIIADTGVAIDISEDGLVSITGGPGTDMEKAIKIIENLTRVFQVGEIYEGEVVKIMDFGAFVRIGPGVDGLVHVSQMKRERVNHPSDVVSEGEKVQVKLLEKDSQGRLKLSMLID